MPEKALFCQNCPYNNYEAKLEALGSSDDPLSQQAADLVKTIFERKPCDENPIPQYSVVRRDDEPELSGYECTSEGALAASYVIMAAEMALEGQKV